MEMIFFLNAVEHELSILKNFRQNKLFYIHERTENVVHLHSTHTLRILKYRYFKIQDVHACVYLDTSHMNKYVL